LQRTCHLEHPCCCEEQVLWLDVPVDNVEHVQVLQRRQEGSQHLAHSISLGHAAATPVKLAKHVTTGRILGHQVHTNLILKGSILSVQQQQ
jgi:hypothetical protein